MLRQRPLAVLALGFLAGIASGRSLDAGAWVLAALGGAAAAAAFRGSHVALLFLAALGAGAARQQLSEGREPLPLSDRVEGVVDGSPRLYRALQDPGPDGEPLGDGSFVVGRVQVRFYRKPVPLIGGERVVARGPMRRPKPATNPGQHDAAERLRRQGIDAVLTLQELEVVEGPPAWSRFRARVRGLFDRGTAPETGAFLSGIVLGRREPMPDELIRDLQRTGTAHLLALSGQNLVIVLFSLWSLLVLAGVQGRPLTAALLALLGLYVLLTDFQVSVVRSYLMLASFLGADLAWRRRDAVSSLSASALLITLADPGQIADVGFQLSFAAVLGLIAVAPAIHDLSGAGGWAWNRLRQVMGASVAAWLATAPIVQENFNLLTPGIVLANLALVPLMSAEFLLGLAHLALAPLGAGVLSGGAADFVFGLLRGAARAVASLPAAYAYAPPPGAPVIAVYAGLLAVWVAWARSGPPRRRKLLGLLVPAALLGLAGPLRTRAPDGVLLAVLDVGRGSCAYLEWPDGRNLMVDCGSLDHRDVGADVAARFLWSRGVTRLDTLVLSHPDADHVNGARSIVELFRVRRLLATRAFREEELPAAPERELVERRGAPERRGDLELLGPPVWEKTGAAVPDNETSIVLRAAGVLLPGDVQDLGVEELLALPDLCARVLVMPHHGKFFKRHEDFVRRVSPEAIVVSAPSNYFSPRVIGALPRPPLITGREGAVLLELRPDVVRRLNP
jgi:competence protein ComEC